MIQDKAMISVLNISAWTSRKFDRQVTSNTNRYYKAGDAGRYNKLLINKEAVDKIRKISSEARIYYRENTLPWLSSGGRILPATLYYEYIREMTKKKNNFNQVVSEFIKNYPDLIEESSVRLGEMFKASDYPHEDELRDKYSFEIITFPIPNENDFRVNLNQDEYQEIKNIIKEDIEKRISDASKDLWLRMFGVVKHMSEKLSDSGGVFRDTLVENIENVCNLAMKLNVMDDPNITRMANEIKDRLTTIDPQTLRKSKAQRKQMATESAAILNKVRGYLAARE